MTDISSTAATSAVFDGNPNLMATFSGELETFNDKDWIKLTLTQGTTYKFFGSAASAGAVGGDSIMRLVDSNGVERAYNNDEISINDYNSFFSFTATTSGTYFVEMSTVGGQPGHYSVAVIANESHTRLSKNADVFSGAGNNLIVGDTGDDFITLDGTPLDAFGEQGNDSIVGDGGSNFISGGLGNDRIEGGDSGDLLLGDAGEDTIDGENGDDDIRGGDGADILEGDSGQDKLFGGSGSDRLAGGNESDVLDGGLGQDKLSGGPGDDQFFVDDAADEVFETVGQGNDTVFATSSFTLATGQEIETLKAQVPASTTALNLTGNEFANTLIGNNGANVLAGGGALDSLQGLLGNDVYALANGTDTVVDSGGIDTITSTISRSLAPYAAIEKLVLFGTAAINGTGNNLANVIFGNAKANILSGGIGKDALSGGAGNDKLIGGTGNDTLTGGANNDVFVFGNTPSASNRDVITDFNPIQDSFHLDNAVFAKLGAAGALKAGFFHAGSAAADANDFIVYNKATGALSYDVNGSGAGGAIQFATLVNKPTLTASDFVVV